jgi:hypothetical protein
VNALEDQRFSLRQRAADNLLPCAGSIRQFPQVQYVHDGQASRTQRVQHVTKRLRRGRRVGRQRQRITDADDGIEGTWRTRRLAKAANNPAQAVRLTECFFGALDHVRADV